MFDLDNVSIWRFMYQDARRDRNRKQQRRRGADPDASRGGSLVLEGAELLELAVLQRTVDWFKGRKAPEQVSSGYLRLQVRSGEPVVVFERFYHHRSSFSGHVCYVTGMFDQFTLLTSCSDASLLFSVRRNNVQSPRPSLFV